MSYCPECGTKVVGTPKFCERCGATLTGVSASSASPTVGSEEAVADSTLLLPTDAAVTPVPVEVEPDSSAEPASAESPTTLRRRILGVPVWGVALVALVVVAALVAVFVVQTSAFTGRERGHLPTNLAAFVGKAPSALESALQPSKRVTDLGSPGFALADVPAYPGKTVEVTYKTQKGVINELGMRGLPPSQDADIRVAIRRFGAFKVIDIIDYGLSAQQTLVSGDGFAQMTNGTWVEFDCKELEGSYSAVYFSPPTTDISEPSARAQAVAAARVQDFSLVKNSINEEAAQAAAGGYAYDAAAEWSKVVASAHLDADNPELDGLPTTSATSDATKPTSSSDSATLTTDALMNMDYTFDLSDGTHRVVHVVDGSWTVGSPDSFDGTYGYLGVEDTHVRGDLNGDGIADAVVTLGANYGGSEGFESLAVVAEKNGQPHEVASVFLGDRVEIDKVSISHERLTVRGLVHGPNDSMAQPTMSAKSVFALRNGKLVVVSGDPDSVWQSE
jgi:hypothetical protein